MKFYGNGHVWDQETQKLLSFQDGIIDTEDERLIKLLSDQGFSTNALPPVPKAENPYYAKPAVIEETEFEVETEIEQPKISPMSEWHDLQKRATELGIPIKGKSKKALLALIKDKESGLDNKDGD